MVQQSSLPVVCLMGPTAAGKTAAAIHIARRLNTEVISVDSALVYRDMDIGTAKPTVAQRNAVVHHLIDILDPADRFSAAAFCSVASGLIGRAHAESKVPVLAGGTMLYFRALQHGLDPLPSADFSIRAELDADAAREGWPALHARLGLIDPIAAARLSPNDSQRVQRALEVWIATGRSLSDHFRGMAQPAEHRLRFVNISLEPSNRAELHQRISTRFDEMLGAGFIDEVRALRRRADLNLALPSMRCVGYRQIWEYLDGRIHAFELREKALAATRQLAKRQLTWLRSFSDRKVVDCLSAEPLAQIDEILDGIVGSR